MTVKPIASSGPIMGSALPSLPPEALAAQIQPADGADHWPLVSLVDLTTQSPHVNVHEIGLGGELIVPDFPKKHCSRQPLQGLAQDQEPQAPC